MRSTQDPIKGLQKYLEDWGVATEEDLKVCERASLSLVQPDMLNLWLKRIDKQAKAVVDQAVEESKASPEPEVSDLWTDIYYKGTEPPSMRGREREEASHQMDLHLRQK